MSEHVENLVERGVRRRRTTGFILLGLTIAALMVLISVDAPRWSRLLLAIPFGVAANGFLQARERTCVVLGAIGKRETVEGGYARMSPIECQIVKRQVRQILMLDVIIAAASAIIVWRI